jgi:hypothetical protein
MFYDVAVGTACLGGHNPPEPDGDRLCLLEQQVRAMTREERAAFLKGIVKDLQAVLDYLDMRKCGEAGEAQFRALAVEHGHSFSVSFVSLGPVSCSQARFCVTFSSENRLGPET